jgi:hypothetical protein
MTLTKRLTKGSRLTHAEMDANLDHLNEVNLSYPESYGAIGDGVTNDRAALSNWVSSGVKRLRVKAGTTYLIGTDTVITVPTGVSIEGGGPTTIFKKSSGTADIFTTTGDNVTFRNFRMEGPNNTSCDGISTDGGSDILIENIEGFQLASTVTIGLTSTTTRPTVNNVFSESNTQQGVHFNLATSPRFHNIRSKNIGSSSLHHGLYIGNCTDVVGSLVDAEGCAGFGLHIFVQSSFNGDRVIVSGVNCRGNGTASSGTRGGIAASLSAATSSLDSLILSGVQCYNNTENNIFIGGVTDVVLMVVHCDGANEATAQGIYIENQFSSTCTARVSGGFARAHDANVRLVVGSGSTLNVSLQDLYIADADTASNAGVYATGTGRINLDIGTGVRFFNNNENINFVTGSPGLEGSVNYASSAIPSGSFTGTLTGVSGSVTGNIKYSVNGDAVTLECPAIAGTSNTTACTITGMPAVIRPLATAGQNCVGITLDNTSTRTVSRIHVGDDGVLTLHVGTSATFTSSGSKGIEPCTFSYRLSQ